MWWALLLICSLLIGWGIWYRLQYDRRPEVDAKIISGFDWCRTDTASMNTLIVGGKGSGKSWGVGTDLMLKRYLAHEPQLLQETTGGTCDAFLWKLNRLAKGMSFAERQRLFARVRYYDMSGLSGAIPSCPLYYRLHPDESLYDIAMRPIDIWLRSDPSLADAPIQGANALITVGGNCGLIAAALGLSIFETLTLLDAPEEFEDEGLFNEAIARDEETRGAVEWFRNTYMAPQNKGGWGPADKQRNTSAFRNKLEQLIKNSTLRCKYSQLEPLDLDEVEQQGLTVIRDHRQVAGDQQRRFSLLYEVSLIKSWARYRERGDKIMHIYLEELTEYTGMDTQASSELFAADINYLLSVEARNKKLGFVCLLQSLSQVSPAMQKSLLVGCGNLVIGKQDMESALILAKELFPFQGGHIKRWEPVYFRGEQGPEVIDLRPVEFGLSEWQATAANSFAQLPGWCFWGRPVLSEGSVATSLLPMRITRDVGHWPDAQTLKAMRQLMALGRSKVAVLAGLQIRLAQIEISSLSNQPEFDRVCEDAQPGYLPT